ncbi:MAG: hypothetical protein K2M55_01950 [Muribaculaceae bacterium]|nr:hypothetical protein [Muribaculaceae bacterium]
MIDLCLKIATEAHRGQKDLDGNPVILHPLTVGLMGKNAEEQCAGFLHDVAEDTDYTFDDLLRLGVPSHIVDALRLLTHEEGTDYLNYVRRIAGSGNQLAIAVKLNDLRHNLKRGREQGYTRLVEKHEAALREFNLPVMMYIHGFRSGANGSKQKELQQYFEGCYRVIAPEVDADPEKSLTIINEMIAREKPEIIVGTSLGGWMTLMCDSGDAHLVVVNPSTDPQHTLSKWVGQDLPYFCERLDGVQTYTLTQQVLDKYVDYDVVKNIQEKSGRLHALCSSADELIGDIHIRTLHPLLPNNRLIIVDDFGHRCSGPGLHHLFEILDKISTF